MLLGTWVEEEDEVIKEHVEMMKIDHWTMSTLACVEWGWKLSLFQLHKIP
jgi:hypothetical protein